MKPKIVLIDNDINYIAPLQQRFIEDFFDKIELEIITDKNYFDQFFSVPQKIDILVIDEAFYNGTLGIHDIGWLFVMKGNPPVGAGAYDKEQEIFKYKSLNEIMNTIVGASGTTLKHLHNANRGPQVIYTYSARGDAGKTLLSLGISGCLARNYKKVLYINAARLQTFQIYLENQKPMELSLANCDSDGDFANIYNVMKDAVRKQEFDYLPPFKASLMSLGMEVSIYCDLVKAARDSRDYDYIVVDGESVLSETEVQLMDAADRVVIVSKPDKNSIYTTKLLAQNINDENADKYIYVFNQAEMENPTKFKGVDSIPSFETVEFFDDLSFDELSQIYEKQSIQRLALMVM